MTRRTSQDPLVQALVKSHKFNLLAAPRAKVDLYDLYMAKGNDILPPGRLESLWETPPTLPDPVRDERFEAPEKTFSRQLELSVAARLTGKLFAAHSATLLDGKLDAAMKKSGGSKAQIRFHDVRRDSVDSIKVHRALVEKNLDETSLVLVSGRKLYLVIGVVRAKGIEIRLENEDREDVQTKVDLGEIAEGSAGITIENKESGSLVFKGKDRIAFGVQTVELRLDHGTDRLHIAGVPPALDFMKPVEIPPVLMGDPEGSIFVDVGAD